VYTKSIHLDELQKAVHQQAVSIGFYEEIPSFPEQCALIHSEVSEALESWRDGKEPIYNKGEKPEGWMVELADCVIRIMDLAEHNQVSLIGIILAKHEYNKTRPYRHGGKRI